MQIQVTEHAALCWDHSHKTGPGASDAIGGLLDCLNPALMVWSVRDFAAQPERRHQPVTRTAWEPGRTIWLSLPFHLNRYSTWPRYFGLSRT